MSKLIKNTIYYTIGNILPQAAGFLLLPVYTKYLTPADYGVVSSMQVLSSVLIVFFTLAIDRSIYRLYFDYKTEKDKRDYLGTITISLLLISIIVLFLLFVFKAFIGGIFQSIDFYPFYAYAILTSFFSIFSILPKIYLQLNEKAGKYVTLSFLQFFISTLLILYFIVIKKIGAEGMLFGAMLGNIIVTPLFVYLSFKIVNFTLKKKIIFKSLSFCLPMIPGLLGAWVLNLSDRIFIERFFDLNDVGIYSMGYKIAGLVLVFSSAFNLAYNPVFYKLANSENQIVAKKTLFNYNRIYVSVVMIFVFIIVLFSKEVVILLLDVKYIDSYRIVPLIALAYLISLSSGIFNLMIYQKKKTFQLMLISLFGALFNILFNLFLIPTYGAYGAAFATIISFIIIFGLSWWYSMKCYFIPIDWKQLIPLFIVLLSIVVIFNLSDLSVIVSLLAKLVVSFAVFGLIIRKYFSQIKVILNTNQKFKN